MIHVLGVEPVIDLMAVTGNVGIRQSSQALCLFLLARFKECFGMLFLLHAKLNQRAISNRCWKAFVRESIRQLVFGVLCVDLTHRSGQYGFHSDFRGTANHDNWLDNREACWWSC